nr:hypothetical protein [Lachnospiraceae bacterium]
MKRKKITKIITASILAVCLAVGTPALISRATTPGQAVNPYTVPYGKVSEEDQKLIRNLFDPVYYAAEHTDVVAAMGTDPDRLWTHFIKHGIFEGRACNAGFNVSVYKSCYKDLQDAFGKDIVAYYRHYMMFGIYEKRKYTTMDAAYKDGLKVYGFVDGKEVPFVPPYVSNDAYNAALAEKEAAAARAKAAADSVSKAEQEKKDVADKIAEETEKAKNDGENKPDDTSSTIPAPKEGYKISSIYAPVSITINKYGNNGANRVITETTTLTPEYDDSGVKLGEKYADG